VLRILLENGARFKHDLKASHRAVQYESEEVLRILLEYGADPNAEDPRGMGETALNLAIERGDKDIEKLLREFVAT
jgi:ankyrin repeat protein